MTKLLGLLDTGKEAHHERKRTRGRNVSGGESIYMSDPEIPGAQ
jgi:hypothetical protein